MKTQAEKVQITHGTLKRNREIYRLYRKGVPQVEIAKRYIVRNHPMTRQQVNEIIKRFQEGE